MTLTSSAFKAGQAIPARHDGYEGHNVSPPLSWANAPAGTKEFALIVDDLDAVTPQGPWVHWVAYKIPASARGLEEQVRINVSTLEVSSPAFPFDVEEGRNSWPTGQTVGYWGPTPPRGVHHYRFTVYALDGVLELKAGATKAELVKAMDARVLATGELVGTYEKK